MDTTTQEKTHRTTAMERLEARIAELSDTCALDHWTSFVGEIPILGDLAPAIITNRPQLLGAVKPRAMDADEVAQLLAMLRGVLETNFALRKHAEELAIMHDRWSDCFTGLRSIGMQIEHFANFRKAPPEDAEAVG